MFTQNFIPILNCTIVTNYTAEGILTGYRIKIELFRRLTKDLDQALISIFTMQDLPPQSIQIFDLVWEFLGLTRYQILSQIFQGKNIIFKSKLI